LICPTTSNLKLKDEVGVPLESTLTLMVLTVQDVIRETYVSRHSVINDFKAVINRKRQFLNERLLLSWKICLVNTLKRWEFHLTVSHPVHYHSFVYNGKHYR
jgi:hypothetical protein